MLGMNYWVRPIGAPRLLSVDEVEIFNVVNVSVPIMYPDHQFENSCVQVFISLLGAQIGVD